MKYLNFDETYEIKNNDNCVATEYDFKDKDIDISTAVINGRYPEAGYAVNEESKEIVLVLEGTGEIVMNGQSISFKAGDAILIDKGEPYYWEANCKIVMSCTPAWTQQQHKIID